jgi:uncharacterized protein YhdP
VTARLQKLDLGGDSEQPSVSTTAAERAAQREAHDPRKWPAIDLVADALWSKGRQLGRLELVGVPGGDDWRVERLRLANPDGDLDVEGWWRGSRPQHTEVGVQLTIRNTSAYLHRLGYPDAVKGAATVIRGQLSWPGGLRAFDYPELAGNFRIETEAGQFTKMDPGFGKLLGVLNLQMLPRRIAFDFRDVFSEGFAFDALSGSVRISNGVMTTSDLQFSGPAARVEIAGEANLVEETQKLTVRVYPSLSSSVAVGAAIGLANPLAGAAVLLGQKLLQDPVDRLFVTEYRVSGPWSDPQVAKVPLLERGNAAAVAGAAR